MSSRPTQWGVQRRIGGQIRWLFWPTGLNLTLPHNAAWFYFSHVDDVAPAEVIRVPRSARRVEQIGGSEGQTETFTIPTGTSVLGLLLPNHQPSILPNDHDSTARPVPSYDHCALTVRDSARQTLPFSGSWDDVVGSGSEIAQGGGVVRTRFADVNLLLLEQYPFATKAYTTTVPAWTSLSWEIEPEPDDPDEPDEPGPEPGPTGLWGFHPRTYTALQRRFRP